VNAAFAGIGTVVDLELRQRVRSTAWYVLLGIFAALIAVITVLLLLVRQALGASGGTQAFSTIVFFVLLLGTLVTPALSGGAISSDRDAGTLATTQVTLATTAQLIVGKFLAAWIGSLAFLVIAVPFLLVSALTGGPELSTIAVSVLITAVELGVIAAVGVGLSALIHRTVFSVVVTYLAVATLSLGTLIAFALGGVAFQTPVTYSYQSYSSDATDASGKVVNPVCDPPDVEHGSQPNFSRVWWLLAANPYVTLADAVPVRWTRDGEPTDLFGAIKAGVGAVQVAPLAREVSSDCDPSLNTAVSTTSEQQADAGAPSWFVGLAIQLALGAAALLFGSRALRTPAKRLARGSRIA
jgi:ABC-2 type transport system permease protein